MDRRAVEAPKPSKAKTQTRELEHRRERPAKQSSVVNRQNRSVALLSRTTRDRPTGPPRLHKTNDRAQRRSQSKSQINNLHEQSDGGEEREKEGRKKGETGDCALEATGHQSPDLKKGKRR
ncbi:unnamed protein product [Microthlaspi erraticum]|uniref:Uncharacterized protein n=1 Tax=Microthlaspi erraticum TaxID=1685480 RepID=A0A6D2J0D8_9BRAS|nr:unnamed protein product [Microthlaspi erraticum]CAA7036413.1 unnamed protein product [Microthlaspi erraticum]